MTAPTKLHIETLREMFAVCANERRMKEADALAAAIAALAPPSGEGVVSGLDDAALLRALAEDVDDMAPEIRTQILLIADHINTGKIRCRRCGEHADVRISTATIPTTPQSAPADGVALSWLDDVLGRMKGQLRSSDAAFDWKIVRDYHADLCRVRNNLTTPPPASQERGGDGWQVVRDAIAIHQSFNTTADMADWLRDLLPPSSAVDGQEHCEKCPAPGECDGKCPDGVDAAEQAKPVTVENAPIGTLAPAIDGGRWCRVPQGWKWNGPSGFGSTFARPGGDWNGKLTMPADEQTQAVERITTLPLWEELELEAAIHPNQYKANCLREAAALLRRLAGGVTVDDAMVQRALGAFDDACIAHNKTAPDPAMYEYRVSWFGYSREHRLVVMRAALIAALGAK